MVLKPRKTRKFSPSKVFRYMVVVFCSEHIFCFISLEVCAIVNEQGFIQDFRFGGETKHLGGSGGMFPQENAK